MKTPLHVAVIEERIEDVSKLIKIVYEKGDRVDLIDTDEWTPLHYAVQSGNINIIKLLLQFGADECEQTKDMESPRLIAVQSRNVNVIKLFIETCDINRKNAQGSTLLHETARFGNSNIIKLLTENGADVNARDENGHTPLHDACFSENNNIIKSLLDAGADVNAKTNENYTPIQIASIRTPRTTRIFKILIDAGSDVNSYNFNRDSPLQRVTSEGNLNAARLLICAGANVNTRTGEENITAFKNSLEILHPSMHFKEVNHYMKCSKLLIYHTDINIIDEEGTNVLTDILESDQYEETREFFYKVILEQVAIFKALDLQIDPNLINLISHTIKYNDYFLKSIEELEKAKTTKLYECWVSFFNLLVDDEFKFVKYAGNQNLVKDFKKRVKEFPIFKAIMQSNVMIGINHRYSFDKASYVLSTYLPIFDSMHLIIKDTLDVLNAKDWKNLC